MPSDASQAQYKPSKQKSHKIIIIIVILPLFHRKNKDFFNFDGLT